MKVSFFFTSAQFLLGLRYDSINRELHICLLPFVIVIERKPKSITQSVAELREKYGHYFNDIDPNELRAR